MKEQTNERDWTEQERAIAKAVRAEGGDVRCRIENGRRIFELIATQPGGRPFVRLGGTVRIT